MIFLYTITNNNGPFIKSDFIKGKRLGKTVGLSLRRDHKGTLVPLKIELFFLNFTISINQTNKLNLTNQTKPKTKTMAFKRTVSNVPLFNLISTDNFTPRGVGDSPTEATTQYRIPEHQRFPSWSLSKKQKLVDSILKNYPIHAFIVIRCLKIVGEEVHDYCNVEDGQTRMTSLQEYLLDGYPSEAGDGPNDGRKFSELDSAVRERFKNYQVTIETFDGRGFNDDVISEIFNRLNSGKPLGDNDKFHSRMNTPIMQFLNELKAHPELRDDIERFIGSIGSGKSRKGLGDIVGVILAVATRNEEVGGQACINTSYEQNYKYLKMVLTAGQKNDVIAFFKAYFVMLHQANDASTARPKKHLYGKLSGVLGLSVCSWVINDGLIREEIKWYLSMLIKNSKYEPSTYKQLTKGDIRNCQGASVERRISKIVAQYNISMTDDQTAGSNSDDENSESDE